MILEVDSFLFTKTSKDEMRLIGEEVTFIDVGTEVLVPLHSSVRSIRLWTFTAQSLIRRAVQLRRIVLK